MPCSPETTITFIMVCIFPTRWVTPTTASLTHHTPYSGVHLSFVHHRADRPRRVHVPLPVGGGGRRGRPRAPRRAPHLPAVSAHEEADAVLQHVGARHRHGDRLPHPHLLCRARVGHPRDHRDAPLLVLLPRPLHLPHRVHRRVQIGRSVKLTSYLPISTSPLLPRTALPTGTTGRRASA